MFTGLIEEVGTVLELTVSGEARRIAVRAGLTVDGVRIGDSIAVNGSCLTVAKLKGPVFFADISPETVYRTVLGHLSPGGRVNLERAAKVGDRLGGHMVTGHIDTVGTLSQIKPEGSFIVYRFNFPKDYSNYVVTKGSIAVDGISLTVAECTETDFAVAVIPHTIRGTTLQYKKAGDLVNLEFDILGKYVEKMLLAREKSKHNNPVKKELSLEDLIKAGY